MNKQRVNALRSKMSDFDAVLMADSSNIGYFTGFFPGFTSLFFVPKDGEECLLVSKADSAFAEETCRCRIEVVGREGFSVKLTELLKNGFKKIGIEEHLGAGMLSHLKKSHPKVSFEVFNGIWDIRSIKSSEEIEAIQRAIKIAEAGLKAAFESVSVGIRECDVAAEVEYQMRKLGAEAFPFNTIVASGSRSADPHATCSERKIREGDVIVIDVGAKYKHYCSDITRTIIVGKNENMEKMLNMVIEAQEAALSVIEPGVKCGKLDDAARKPLRNAGYEDYFTHGLGHGIGLDVHEPPSINSSNKESLKEMMVFTVEPGIYIHGIGGVRVEDIVVVKKKGGKILTKLPKIFTI